MHAEKTQRARRAADQPEQEPPPRSSAFLSLPESIHHSSIRPFLATEDCLAAGLVAKALVPYSGGFSSVTARPAWTDEDMRALLGFLLRQQALAKVAVSWARGAPALLEFVASGAARQLKHLELRWVFNVNPHPEQEQHAAALTALLVSQRDLLPALEVLKIESRWPSHRRRAALLEALGQGTCPRLRELSFRLDSDGDNLEEELALLATALEARRERGCVGLARFDMDPLSDCYWYYSESLEVRRRLRALLLPTMAACDVGVDSQWKEKLYDAIEKLGAPSLRRLAYVEDARAVRLLPRLPQLEELVLACKTLEDVRVLEETAQEADGWARFLCALRLLEFYFDESHADLAVAQLAGMSHPNAFAGVQKLSMSLLRSQAVCERLGDTLAAGAFAALRTLDVTDLIDIGFEALVGKMATAPCSRTLQEIALDGHMEEGDGLKAGAGLTALGLAIGAGKLPALVRLGLKSTFIGRHAMEQFVSALGAAGGGAPSAASLEEICLVDTPSGMVARLLWLQVSRRVALARGYARSRWGT